MQIAIRFRRNWYVHNGVLTLAKIFIGDLKANKVSRRASASLIVGSSKRKQRITAYDLISRIG
uniref:Uncharacterized protein n=1 Tax=Salmonella sp. TaxID=599 RepID=A0A482EVV0_SALSP|nr:hypothetical protein NNIBIDOC_00016 [Salmonella sp.]